VVPTDDPSRAWVEEEKDMTRSKPSFVSSTVLLHFFALGTDRACKLHARDTFRG
jgi:hypothetical protein